MKAQRCFADTGIHTTTTNLLLCCKMGGFAIIGKRIWTAAIVGLIVVEEQRALAFQNVALPKISTLSTRFRTGHNTRPHQRTSNTKSAFFTQMPLFLSSPEKQQAFIDISEIEKENETAPPVLPFSSSPFDRPLLMALDVASLTAFAAVGKTSHAPDGSVDAAAVAVTAAPFVAAWLGTSPWTGVYRSLAVNENDNLRQVAVAAIVQTVQGWALAVPLGCVLRGVIKGYVPPVPFVVVTLVATLVILGGTRTLYALAEDTMIQKE